MNEKQLRKKIFNTITKLITESVGQGFFPIETPIGSNDYKLFEKIVNQGIDSSLEGFTKSKFGKSPHFDNKALFNFSKDELPILLRRLEQDGSEEALDWKQAIEDSNNTPEENIDEDNGSMLDVLGQFNMPDDLDYIPTHGDVRAIEDTWGRGSYQHSPMSDDEKKGISNNLNRAKLDLDSDKDEYEQIQKSLDKENGKNIGGYKGKKQSNLGSSMN